MRASLDGFFEIVKILFENNADVNIQDNVFFFFFLSQLYQMNFLF
jgi:hypothetical protein